MQIMLNVKSSIKICTITFWTRNTPGFMSVELHPNWKVKTRKVVYKSLLSVMSITDCFSVSALNLLLKNKLENVANFSHLNFFCLKESWSLVRKCKKFSRIKLSLTIFRTSSLGIVFRLIKSFSRWLVLSSTKNHRSDNSSVVSFTVQWLSSTFFRLQKLLEISMNHQKKINQRKLVFHFHHFHIQGSSMNDD